MVAVWQLLQISSQSEVSSRALARAYCRHEASPTMGKSAPSDLIPVELDGVYANPGTLLNRSSGYQARSSVRPKPRTGPSWPYGRRVVEICRILWP